MTKTKTSSASVTACPECDSGNLHRDGSSVECLSCDWKHTAKKPRTATKAAPATPSVAEQLQAAVTAPTKADKPKAAKVPSMTLALAKEFRPRTNNAGENAVGRFAQMNNWEALVAALQSHGGHLTYAEAVQAVLDAAKAKGYEATCNARGFVQGRVRNGHLKAV